MQDVADQSVTPTTMGADLCAIFVSLELSRSTWLATSLSPGRGEKMSKHSVSAGDIAALLARFSELRRKACARTGKSFPIVVIQEAGLDGFWIHRVLLSNGEGGEAECVVEASPRGGWNLDEVTPSDLPEGSYGRCHTNLDRRSAGFGTPLNFKPRWRLATSGTLRLLGREACGGM